MIYCKILAFFLIIILSAVGCSMDEGASGEIEEQDIFLLQEGCIMEAADASGEPVTFSALIPYGVSLLDATLETFRSEIDLLFGAVEPPLNYFSTGPVPGRQTVRVGPASYQPLQARTWFVTLVSPWGVPGECEPDQAPDWRILVHRTRGSSGVPLLDEDCSQPGACDPVPGCSVPGACSARRFSLEVPPDASSLEIVLESLEGDADLFVGTGTQEEALSSLNPGTGYDILRLDQDYVLPLRGQVLSVRLESWEEPTARYRLRATYVPGLI